MSAVEFKRGDRVCDPGIWPIGQFLGTVVRADGDDSYVIWDAFPERGEMLSRKGEPLERAGGR
jgi:hypothetical protein